MIQTKKRCLVLAVLLFTGIVNLCATSRRPASTKTPVENLYQKKLDNGLTVFAVENHAVPLVYIEIAVRAGATTQTAETAGLFHLYEHMMFKGNTLYKDAASVQQAISDMGVSNWNGTTGTNCVNYFFTIPKDQLENGMAFWNAAIRSPLMKPEELENEKKVVLAEIEGDATEPGWIYSDYVNLRLFPNAPYRADAGGSFEVVRNATVAQLRDMQSKYYIPKNAALFIGGDIDAEETFALAEKIFGNWSNNGNEAPATPPQQDKSPFDSVQYAVMPYDRISPQIASINISFRGPDTDFNIADTYAIDYLVKLLDDPDGLFKQTLANDGELMIPDTDYVYGGYLTTRANGHIDFGATVLSPSENLTARVDSLLSQIQGSILPAMANDKALFSRAKIKEIARTLEDNDILHAQTATGLLSTLRFWWTCASPEYYYTYNTEIAKVKQKDVQKLLDNYITGKHPLVTVLVNPDVYEALKTEFAQAGYDVVTSENAFWWRQAQFAPDPAKIAQETAEPAPQTIYAPQGKLGADSYELNDTPVNAYTLKNGIPVYVQYNKGNRVDSVNIVVRGGISHLTPESSGLEAALFDMMASSSESYNKAARDSLSFATQAGISSYTKVAGSALSLGTIDSYLYDMLPVFVDGFLHPSFEQSVYDNLMTEYEQGIQSTLNDPESLLSYEMNKAIFAGHPYETKAGVTPDSFPQITIENMKALHRTILNASDIFVVAVGNIDARKLVAELDKTLGKLEARSAESSKVQDVPPVSVGTEAQVLVNKSTQGTGYVSRVFAAPPSTSEDYIPAVLASDIYSTILFNVVREHYGACYSPSTGIVQSKAPIGQEYLYKLSNPEHFAEYMAEARGYMARGQVIDSVKADGTYSFSSIADVLQSKKNAYIISTYQSQETTGGVATSLLYNMLSYNDMFFGKKLAAKVQHVTSEQILDVFKRYWIDAASQWWVIVGPDDEGKVRKALDAE